MNDPSIWLPPAVIIGLMLILWRRTETRLDALSKDLANVDRRVARIEGLLEGMQLKANTGTPLSQPPGGPLPSESGSRSP